MASNDPFQDFLRQMFGQGQAGHGSGAGGGSGDGGSGGDREPEIKMPQMPHFKFNGRSKKFWIIFAIVAIVVIGFLYWWFHPSLSPQSPDLWFFVGIFICLPAFIIFRSLYQAGANPTGPVEVEKVKRAKTWKRLSWIPVAIVAVGLIGALLSATFFPFNAQKYASVLTTDECDFATDIEQVDYSQVPVIDRASATLLGNRALGEIPDYVSQFEISSLYSQINYNDKPVRVSPLGYADFFKWITNRDPGIPAYVMVDMTTQDVQVVRLEEAMKYTQSEPFFRNIDRYVQLKYPFYLFDELAFEVDDDGHPYWICPVQTRTIGLFGGTTISRVVLVDACTGECQDMAIDEVPEWVDRAYPAELLIEQYNWWGLYCNGWWNSWIGQEGVRQTTPGTSGQVGYNYLAKDDDVWVYSGVTSATSDNSIIGFVLINQRTAESHYYPVAGATEESAMSSAEGQVQQYGYEATFPLLINIQNQPTYFMALKDGAGLVKKYAMIDIQRYQNVAIGDTVEECQASYENMLVSTGVLSGDEVADIPSVSVTGTVEKVATAVIDGNSHFYLTLEGDSRIFDCALPDIMAALQVEVGDEVTMVFVEGTSTCSVTSLERVSAETATSNTGGATDGSTAAGSSTTADSATDGSDAADGDAGGTSSTSSTGSTGSTTSATSTGSTTASAEAGAATQVSA